MNVTWKTCVRVGISVFILYLCIFYWQNAAGILAALLGAVTPLFLGCAIAYFVNILMSLYESHFFISSNRTFVQKSRRPVCMVLAFATLLAIMVLVVCLVVPQLSSCIQLLLSALPGVMESLTNGIEKLNILPENVMESLSAVDWQTRIGEVLKSVISGLGNVMGILGAMISTVLSGVVTIFMAVIFAIYLLAGKEKLGQQSKRLMCRYMSKNLYEKCIHFLTVLNACFRNYIVGQCTEAVILGLLCMGGMFLLRLPYAAMVGALIAFTALIPVAGAYIGAGVGAFMILTVSPGKAVVFLIFIVVLQQLEGNLIYPRVVGSSIGLPALWVLAAVTVGGGIMGIGGMLLGVPIAATAYQLLREDVYRSPRVEISVDK
ncbi:MAG: AI-2E family transporter [Eubacteriales bacterium]|nr:AI-2E family transporter [Eubacteriales bacterium]